MFEGKKLKRKVNKDIEYSKIKITHPVCVASHTPYKFTGSNIPKLNSTITVAHTQHITLVNEGWNNKAPV